MYFDIFVLGKDQVWALSLDRTRTIQCQCKGPVPDEEREQTRPSTQNPGGFVQGPRLGSHDAGGLEGSDATGAERMDLLGDLGQARNDAQPPNPTRGRGAPGGQTSPLLLARLSASPTQREEVVREASTLTMPALGGPGAGIARTARYQAATRSIAAVKAQLRSPPERSRLGR